jgi:micrococcal nuclease
MTTSRFCYAISLIIVILLMSIILFSLNACGLYYEYSDEINSNDIKESNITNTEESESYGNLTSTLVKEVIDGDTIILSNDERVRLIGVNTPEYGRYYFDEARELMEILTLGKEVMLERDITDRDKYGRLLRYVYVNGLFVNLEMIERGFANAYTYPPDVKYTEKFLEAERYARSNDIGLWERSKITIVKIDINYDAEGNDNQNLNDEYVIIENISSKDVNVGDWTVKDSGTNIYKFCSFLFKKDSIMYLFSGSGIDSNGSFYWGGTRPVWNNDHDTLYLRDDEGLLVEIYNY